MSKKEIWWRRWPGRGVVGSSGNMPNVPLKGRLQGVSGMCREEGSGPVEFDLLRFDRRPSDMNAA